MLDAAAGIGQDLSSHWVQVAAGAARQAARRRRLTPTDADELRSEVWLKLLQRDGAVLKQFNGRGSLQSYLTSVADRCVLDRRVRELGKWRPSKQARVSGATAVLVERLTQRDGMLLVEAVNTIRSRDEAGHKDLEAATSAIPPARPRRRTCSLDSATTLVCERNNPEAQLETTRAARRAEVVRTALIQSLRLLTDDDRHLLKRRFVDGDSVAEISRREGREQKALYRRVERLYKQLRMQLAAFGITSEDVRSILGSAACPLEAILSQPTNRAPVPESAS